MSQKLSSKKGTRLPDLVFRDGKLTSKIDIVIEVLDAFPFYVLLVDSAHNIQFANKAAINSLNLDPQEIIGKYCPLVVHGLSQPYPGCPLEEAVQIGHSIERELFDQETGRWVNSAAYFTDLCTHDGKTIFLHIIKDITEEKHAVEKLDQNYQLQEGLNKLLQISLTNSSLEEQIEHALNLITSIPLLSLQSKGGIFLVEEDSDVLVMKANRGLEKLQTTCARVPFGKCLCGRAAETGKIVYATSIDDRHEIKYEGIKPHGHYCVAIKSAGLLLGVICLYIEENTPRDSRIEGYLISIADVLAGIIVRKRTQEELNLSLNKIRNALGGTIQAMSMAVESRDPYTSGHQRRVANLARAIATEMGLSDDQIDGIRMAASIHDIGKIAIPIEILSKPGQLSEIEFSLIKTHSQIGYDILESIDFSWPVAQIVLQHHEKQNGTGYPNGLSGENILIEARVITVADVIEAMVSHRPYRAAHDIKEALDEISSKKGSYFDSDVVDACLRLFKEKDFKIDLVN